MDKIVDDILLSICIATRNRGPYIGETLASILGQCHPGVEVVVVDGASTDDTGAVVSALAHANPQLRYLPQTSNSGVDGDFDKAVELARGRYCWLMPDDDVMIPGAIAAVMEACSRGVDAVIVDAEVRSADLAEILIPHRLGFGDTRFYSAQAADLLLAECGRHLTYIGAVVVRRQLWLARERKPYYGTEFIHLGVLFQAPLPNGATALGPPLIMIRYGVGNWSSRSFEVWMYKWPALIWSFGWLSIASRLATTRREPWRSFPALVLYRAKGWYSWEDFVQIVRPRAKSRWHTLIPGFIALLPGGLLNAALLALARILGKKRSGGIYDLKRSAYFVGRR